MTLNFTQNFSIILCTDKNNNEQTKEEFKVARYQINSNEKCYLTNHHTGIKTIAVRNVAVVVTLKYSINNKNRLIGIFIPSVDKCFRKFFKCLFQKRVVFLPYGGTKYERTDYYFSRNLTISDRTQNENE